MSILNKYKRWVLQLHLLYDKYWDFVLSMDNTPTVPINKQLTEDNLICYIDTNVNACIKDKSLWSMLEYTWGDAVNSGSTLYDIGLTEMDNGFIHFDKCLISNKEYLNLLTGSTLDLSAYKTSLVLNPVTGNTEQFIYPCKIDSDDNFTYYSFDGGFLQGFYKIYGVDYQILPNTIENTWHFEFVIRPRKDAVKESTLNEKYPNNKGIFFYIGTRSENKFAQFYNSDLSNFNNKETEEDAVCNTNSYLSDIESSEDTSITTHKRTMLPSFWQYWLNDYHYYNENDCRYGGCQICKDYKKESKKEIIPDCDKHYLSESEYIDEDIDLSNIQIETSEGKSIEKSNYQEIDTDNKFLLFNRTCDGYTTENWDESNQVKLTGYTYEYATNLFLLMNRTKTGFTTNNIEQSSGITQIDGIDITSSSSTVDYNVVNDIMNNAFALKINDDGSIGYRYLCKDCDNENKWSIKEEYSFPNIVKFDEWSTINVMFSILNGSVDECGNSTGNRKMKIFIYVNGFLKFVSKELDEFNFKAINEEYDKQEGVPYNISLGGGTQGLSESIWLDYNKPFGKLLPLEENFAGSFIGDIMSFKIYDSELEYNQVKNNYLYENNKIWNYQE